MHVGGSKRAATRGSPWQPPRALGWKEPTADSPPRYSVDSQPKSAHVLRSQLSTWFGLGKLLPCSSDTCPVANLLFFLVLFYALLLISTSQFCIV